MSFSSSSSSPLSTSSISARAERKILWGDTHLDTSNSFDAFRNRNMTADPATAYRFAKGLPVIHPGNQARVQIGTLLDFPELGGKKINKGDKVVLWYVSANRDETVIPRANEFLIDRASSKQHLSFGWGVHFCMGSRLAEMQLRVLWEEIMTRFRFIEVVGEPIRVKSPFVKGSAELPVCVHPCNSTG